MGIPKILKIIRIHIVAGGVLAFSLGVLLAISEGGSFDASRVFFAYVIVLLGDLSAHYSNDYFDVEVDQHIKQKKFFGGSNILVGNPRLRSISKSISLFLLVSSNICAVLLVLFLGAPVVFCILFLFASLVGWIYSAPPLRLVSTGLGEFAVALVTGFAIPGLGYLAVRGQFDPLFAYFAVPFVMYGLILSLTLEAPDVDFDRIGGKTNLVVRKGARNVFFLVAALGVFATLAFFVAGSLVSSSIDIELVLIFSLVPLISGLFGLGGVLKRGSVNRFSALSVASLFVFNILMITYLFSKI